MAGVEATTTEGSVTRARVAMLQLLIQCFRDPLDPEPLQAAAAVQEMILDDLPVAVYPVEGPA